MKMRRIVVLALVTLATLPAAASAQNVARPSASPAGDSAGYYFLLGRHHESQADVDKALEAHKRAIQLAPESAELRAELAGVYARADRALEAIDAADEALKIDPQNREANRISGSIYAAFAEQRRAIRPGESPQLYVARAIAALERARQDGPAELGLDLTLARLYLQTESFEKAEPLLRRIVTEQPGTPTRRCCWQPRRTRWGRRRRRSRR